MLYKQGKIKDIYIGSAKISKVYKGNILVYQALAFPIGTVLLERATVGSQNITLPSGKYEVIVVGAGGGGVGCAHGGKWFYADGGGGACFKGIIKISKEANFTATVGTGGKSQFNPSSASDAGSTDGTQSNLGNLIIAKGGMRGSGTNAVYPGKGGELIVNATVISSTIRSNGNNATGGGLSGHGQAQSLYGDYGKGGQGIYGGSVNGTNGYIKITYVGN